MVRRYKLWAAGEGAGVGPDKVGEKYTKVVYSPMFHYILILFK